MEIYVVRSCDTVYQIARRYSTSMDGVISAHQMQNPNVLSVGQALIIPNHETRHTVSRGDTLYSIAHRHDVSL